MNKHFGEWYRVANIQPQHELVQARWQGVEGFCKEEGIGCCEVMELVRAFFQLQITDVFREKFIESFYDVDNAFPRSKNDAELSVLAGATLNHIAENNVGELRIFTLLAIKSASFKRKAIVPAIFTIMNDLFYEDALAIRNIGSLGEPRIVVPATKSLKDSLKVVEESDSWAPAKVIAKQLSAYLVAQNKAFDQLTNSLNDSVAAQAVYREDSQILWWLTGGYSKDQEKPFAELRAAEAPLVIGKELADLVETLPGPYSARAVINKLLNISHEEKAEVVLSTAINQTAREWRNSICNTNEFETISERIREIAPILAAICESLRVEKAEEWLAAYKKRTGIAAKTTKLDSVELSHQVYLECLLLKAYGD